MWRAFDCACDDGDLFVLSYRFVVGGPFLDNPPWLLPSETQRSTILQPPQYTIPQDKIAPNSTFFLITPSRRLINQNRFATTDHRPQPEEEASFFKNL